MWSKHCNAPKHTKGLTYLAGKPLQRWATITVNPEIVTWETPNDLCTFYRNPTGELLLEGPLNSTNNNNYHTKPPPATSGVIPLPPNKLPEPVSSCIHCCLLKREKDHTPTKDQKLKQQLPNSADATEQLKNVGKPYPIQTNKSKFVPHAELVTNNNPVSSPYGISSHDIKHGSTTTTQLHRNQLCSTTVIKSSPSLSSEKFVSKTSSPLTTSHYPITSSLSTTTTQLSRPPTPHKPSYHNTARKSIISSPPSKEKSGVVKSFQQKALTTSSYCCSLSSLSTPITSSRQHAANIGSSKITRNGSATTSDKKPKTNHHLDNLSTQSSYPLKKHPLINIKPNSSVHPQSNILHPSSPSKHYKNQNLHDQSCTTTIRDKSKSKSLLNLHTCEKKSGNSVQKSPTSIAHEGGYYICKGGNSPYKGLSYKGKFDYGKQNIGHQVGRNNSDPSFRGKYLNSRQLARLSSLSSLNAPTSCYTTNILTKSIPALNKAISKSTSNICAANSNTKHLPKPTKTSTCQANKTSNVLPPLSVSSSEHRCTVSRNTDTISQHQDSKNKESTLKSDVSLVTADQTHMDKKGK